MNSQLKNKKEEATIIDANNLVLGRMGSIVAKRLLLGEEIKIINCKDVIMLGKKKFLVKKYKDKFSNKVVKQGPYYSRSPAEIVRRSLRNMLPYKNSRGVEAYSRLKCYNSLPSILANSKKNSVENAKMNPQSVFYYTKVGELSEALGFVRKQ